MIFAGMVARKFRPLGRGVKSNDDLGATAARGATGKK
jgi:hypothetical protein